MDSTAVGSTSHTNLKESSSSQDTKATPPSNSSSKTFSSSQKLSRFSGIGPYGKKRIGGKAIKKDPMLCEKNQICNHLEYHIHLSNKKALYYNMKTYYECMGEDPFNFIPLTYHIKDGSLDCQFEVFRKTFEQLTNGEDAEGNKLRHKVQNIWIVKPGENTNRGNGINVCKDFEQIVNIVDSNIKLRNGKMRSYIIQKYIERPLLVHKRKFDIRCFSLVTSINGNICGYWYKDGYIRTS